MDSDTELPPATPMHPRKRVRALSPSQPGAPAAPAATGAPEPPEKPSEGDMMLKTLGFSTFLPLRSSKAPTLPEEFRFATSRRAALRAEVATAAPRRSPFVSGAQFAANFQRKTPVRFHTKSRRPGDKPKVVRFQLKLTQPVSPKFTKRHRATQVESTEQKSLAETTRQFKANPVNERALRGEGALFKTTLFRKTVAPKPRPDRTTRAPFSFQAPPASFEELRKKKYEHPKESAAGHESVYVFKAGKQSSKHDKENAPENKASAQAPAPAPAQGEEKKLSEEKQAEIKARRKVVAKRHRTQPKPFGLATEARGELHHEEWQQKLEQERREEEQRRKFVAHAPPAFAAPQGQPHHDPLKLTVPHPFHLESETRSVARTQHLRDAAPGEENAYRFKAQPYVKYPEPKLARSMRPLTRVDNVVLASDRRAAQRAEFEEQKRLKERLAAQRNAERLAELQEMERREIAEMRRRMVPKATPIMPDSIVEIKPANKFTVPQSPRLLTKARAQGMAKTLRIL
eukprot:m51a1_g2738 hypothetical protein (515) ;mRNA; f:904334-906229